jgi:hypothetical protein
VIRENDRRELRENRARRHSPQFVERTAGGLIETGEDELDEDRII